MTDAPYLPGFTHVEPDDGTILEHDLYFGSVNDEILDHWYYVTEPEMSPLHPYMYGLIIPGSFDQSIVLTMCVTIDGEIRERDRRIAERQERMIERFAQSLHTDGPWA